MMLQVNMFCRFIIVRKEALVQQQIKTLLRDPKVLAKIYGLFYGAKTYLFIQLPS